MVNGRWPLELKILTNTAMVHGLWSMVKIENHELTLRNIPSLLLHLYFRVEDAWLTEVGTEGEFNCGLWDDHCHFWDHLSL